MRSAHAATPFLDLIAPSPVIPAVRDARVLGNALRAPGRVVYVLYGAVGTVAQIVEPFRVAGKHAFVNVDLVDGLRSDGAAVQFLADCGATGIISTHTEALRAARTRGLLAVQRSFLLDSHAAGNALSAIDRFRPDAVELLPAPAAPYVIERLVARHPDVVPTAGGLIRTLSEIDDLVRLGIRAVSVSETALWVV
jgi:glycerol uptake operon antiterminator